MQNGQCKPETEQLANLYLQLELRRKSSHSFVSQENHRAEAAVYSTPSGREGIHLLNAVKTHVLRLVESSIPSLPLRVL